VRVWKVTYTDPQRWANGLAVVLAVTAGDAIKKCRMKLKLGPHRILDVELIHCDELIVK
jgi:hypothetical protein